MQFVNGFLGGADIILPPVGGHLTASVTLANQATKVAAFLRGFDVGYNEGDNHLKRIEVIVVDAVLRTDKKTVDVTARVELRDQHIDGETIHGSVYYTLIAE